MSQHAVVSKTNDRRKFDDPAVNNDLRRKPSPIWLVIVAFLLDLIRGGGKALTMTMTPWNLPHGQWSKKLAITMTTWNLPWLMVKIDQF